MTVAQAIIAIRAATAHDSDTQVTDAQLLDKFIQEYKRLRRWLVMSVPTIYESSIVVVVASGTPYITKASLANFERLRKLERDSGGGNYYPVWVEAPLTSRCPQLLSVSEQGAFLYLDPPSSSPGTYRVTWLTGLGTITTGSTVDVPDGLEDVVIERCAAWVRQRHDENPSYHLQMANSIMVEQRRLLRQRYGVHPQPGLALTRY